MRLLAHTEKILYSADKKHRGFSCHQRLSVIFDRIHHGARTGVRAGARAGSGDPGLKGRSGRVLICALWSASESNAFVSLHERSHLQASCQSF